MPLTLHPHQVKAVEDLANGKVLKGKPGSGKSFASLAYFWTKECGGVLNDWGSIKTPKHLFILTTAKKRDSGDWQKDAYKLGLMEDPEISVAGIKVTVDSWNNIEKYLDVEGAFFIFDEQKVVGAGVWSKSFIKLTKKNRWILLTGTPGDVWMDYLPIFLANGFYKNRTEFKDKHVVYASWTKFPKIERYIGLGQLIRNRDAVLVEMPYDSHTKRHLEVVVVAHDEEELERVTKRRWNVYESRPLRDVAELFSVSRKVVNSDPSRLQKIRELQRKHKRIIVFYNFDYELELLRTLAMPEMSTSLTNEDMLLLTNSSETCEKDAWEYLLSPEGKTKNDTIALRHSSMETQPASTTSNSVKISSDSSTMSSTAASLAQAALDDRRNARTRTSFRPERTAAEYEACEPSPASLTKLPRGTDGASRMMAELDRRQVLIDTTGSTTPSSTSAKTSLLESPSTSTPHHGPSSSSPSSPSTDGSVTIAEWNGHKHQPVPETDEWIYLVQYRAGAEAWNCTTTDAMAFYSMTYSYKDFEQTQGRIDRLNTPFVDLWYYVLMSESWIDKAIKKALDLKQDFNEKRHSHRIAAANYDAEIYEREDDG